jgi:hypothetical protein
MNGIGDWYYGLVVVGIVAVFVILIYTAWKALFGDKKNRERRRCPECWYDLAYSPGMTCGECGFTAKRESQFHVVRRRIRVAVGAMLACVALAIFINEHMAPTGWAAALPTRALIWMMPLGSGPNNSISREITTRAAMGKLSNAEWMAIIDRCVSGDMANRPTSAAWRAKYGNFIWLWRPRLLGTSAIDAKLNAVPMWIDVNSRGAWPADSPLTVQVDVKDWWSWGQECRVLVTPRIGEKRLSEPQAFRRTGDDRIPRRGFSLALPPMAEGEVELSLDMEIYRRPMRAAKSAMMQSPEVSSDGDGDAASTEDSWEFVSKRTVTQNLRIERPGKSTLVALEQDSVVDTMVSQVFGGGAVKWNSGPSPVRVRVDQRATAVPELNDVAMGVHVDLLRDGELARRLNLWWIAGTNIEDTNYGFEIEFENIPLLRTAGVDEDRWSMRIWGDEMLALRAAGGKKFWKGDITRSMRVQPMPGQSPGRAWWKEE